jgi:hypothetical protein
MRAMRTSWIDVAQSGDAVTEFAWPQATSATEFLRWGLSRQLGKRVHRLPEEGSTAGDRPPSRDTPARLPGVGEEMPRGMRGSNEPGKPMQNGYIETVLQIGHQRNGGDQLDASA